MGLVSFEWGDKKNNTNRKKHGVSFFEAQKRFWIHNVKIRIIGAGFWRKGKKIYEEEQIKKQDKIH